MPRTQRAKRARDVAARTLIGHRNEAEMISTWMQQQLRRSAERHADLAPIVAALERGADVAKLFAVSRKLKVTFGTRALVHRILLDDRSVVREAPLRAPSVEMLTNLIPYLEITAPQLLSRGLGRREEIPKHIRGVLGLPSAAAPAVVSASGWLPLAWSHATHRRREPSPELAAAYERYLAYQTLTPELAREFADPRTPLSPRSLAWFLETGIDALDVRNGIVLATAVLADRRGGRAQNRLPLQMSRRFGLAPRSIPDMLGMLDVLQLALDGCINWEKTKDPLGLRTLVDTVVPDGFWNAAVEPLRGQWILAAEESARGPFGEGVFDSGLLFNTQRLAGIAEGRASRLVGFKDYYTAIGTDAIEAHVLRHMHESALVRRRIPVLVKAGRADGIAVRELANLLRVVEVNGDDAARILPSVARYRLGVPEPVPGGRGHGTRRRRSSVETDRVDRRFERELEALAKRRYAYVIRPSFAGEMPRAGMPIFIPRSIAAGLCDLPRGIVLTGPPRVRLGVDPYQPELNPEWHQYDEVRQLT